MCRNLAAACDRRLMVAWLLCASVIAGVLFQLQGVQAARADSVYTDTVTFPSGIDAGLAISVIQLFLTIGASLIALVLGVKILPKIVKYVFKWIRMAVA